MLLTLAAKHRPWLRTLRRNPQRKAISVEVSGASGYLQNDEKWYVGVKEQMQRTLNSTSMTKLAAVRGRRLQSHPCCDAARN